MINFLMLTNLILQGQIEGTLENK
ncbi:uncharacterized protein METZ01_LOCUS294395 [marine metagenome]|uniref:Uncharacterized protein n=1 Tax=marine metagenome TaxID=408172 RepID=A0A382M2X7_9ZZZZ